MSSSERIEAFLTRVCVHIRWRPYRNRIRRELTDHILTRVEYLMNDRGYSESEAVAQAICMMGDPDEIGAALHREGRPLRRILFVCFTCVIWAGIVCCLIMLLNCLIR